MSEQPNYFSNHSVKLKFPWRLYHAPIVAALKDALVSANGPAVLNLGSGPFLELRELDTVGRELTLCDIDERAITQARELWGSRLSGSDILQAGAPLPYPDDHFDLVVSMDVIEHLDEPVSWAREAFRVLKPSGTLFLTTPNYASLSLRVLEGTVLEGIARYQGFSRKHIHPSKMDPERLNSTLLEAGAQRLSIQTVAFGWVLTAHAQKRVD